MSSYLINRIISDASLGMEELTHIEIVCAMVYQLTNLLRMIDDVEVREPLKFLRAREIVHFQRFGEALENTKGYPGRVFWRGA